jgi:N-acylglucosamine-6-phosphate 2-epimerase
MSRRTSPVGHAPLLVAAHLPPLVRSLQGGLIVSCQAPVGSPMRDPAVMAAVAAAVAAAGAIGIRANAPDHVRHIRAAVDLPLIGLWKDGDTGVYLTPTARHAVEVLQAGADIVAVDATARDRPDGRQFRDTVAAVHQAGGLVMADVSSLAEGRQAADDGADMVATTLSGYTHPGTPSGPDLDLIERLADTIAVPVVAEGRIASPADAVSARNRGAWAVVVGTAITAPDQITAAFVRELASA